MDGFGEKGWCWKGLELTRETKLIRSNGKYFCTVATPNREKPKKEEKKRIEILNPIVE